MHLTKKIKPLNKSILYMTKLYFPNAIDNINT